MRGRLAHGSIAASFVPDFQIAALVGRREYVLVGQFELDLNQELNSVGIAWLLNALTTEQNVHLVHRRSHLETIACHDRRIGKCVCRPAN